MSTLSSVGRALVTMPRALVGSTYTKASAAMASYIGLSIGATAREEGRNPESMIETARSEIIAADGTLAETTQTAPSPVEEAAADAVGSWVTEPVVTTPDAYNAAVEQTVIVPMVRMALSLTEVAAGVGYWLGGTLHARVVTAIGAVIMLAWLAGQLRLVREVAL